MTIGQKIQFARKKAKYTQKTLAELCGVATGTIQQYELGKRQPRYEQLQIIAKALNMHLSDFLDDDCFDAATLPDSEYEDKLIEDKFKFITENEQYSEKEKKILLQDLFTQVEIMADIHSNNAKAAGKYLLNNYFDKLNFNGQEKAIEQVEMLTKIPEYQREALKNYAEFVSDKTPEYWEGLKQTLQQIDADRALTSEPILDEERRRLEKRTQD